MDLPKNGAIFITSGTTGRKGYKFSPWEKDYPGLAAYEFLRLGQVGGARVRAIVMHRDQGHSALADGIRLCGSGTRSEQAQQCCRVYPDIRDVPDILHTRMVAACPAGSGGTMVCNP